jgi:4-hydroxythreonine-4-phosphate dehydrogenase
MEYLDKALELIKNQEIDCLVTCPLSKEAVNLAGFSGFSGHTEYLARYAKVKNYVMMLANKYLRFSLVTRHIPLAKVSKLLSIGDICATLALTQKYLKDFFAISNPRLVVLGLNPHASDNGLIGDEEGKIITPAVKIMRKKIKHLDGPLPADVGVRHLAQKKYDAAIAMYHDQALIPLKLLGGLNGTNLTLGLPFVRVSPLHGTAFDIAASDIADPASLIEAIKLAALCTTNLKNI